MGVDFPVYSIKIMKNYYFSQQSCGTTLSIVFMFLHLFEYLKNML